MDFEKVKQKKKELESKIIGEIDAQGERRASLTPPDFSLDEKKVKSKSEKENPKKKN